MKIRKLQGIVVGIEKTGEFKDIDDEKWQKCIFTVRITDFSRRTPEEIVPKDIKGKIVRMVRYCCYDWHYKTGFKKTLEPEETESLLNGKPIETVYW